MLSHHSRDLNESLHSETHSKIGAKWGDTLAPFSCVNWISHFFFNAQSEKLQFIPFSSTSIICEHFILKIISHHWSNAEVLQHYSDAISEGCVRYVFCHLLCHCAFLSALSDGKPISLVWALYAGGNKSRKNDSALMGMVNVSDVGFLPFHLLSLKALFKKIK